jgi:hypothetical protein
MERQSYQRLSALSISAMRSSPIITITPISLPAITAHALNKVTSMRSKALRKPAPVAMAQAFSVGATGKKAWFSGGRGGLAASCGCCSPKHSGPLRLPAPQQ